MYNIITICKVCISFIVILKYWLYSQCSTTYLVAYFIHISLYFFKLLNQFIDIVFARIRESI